MSLAAFTVAIVAALLSGLLSTLHMSLREASRGRVMELARARRVVERVEPLLDEPGPHALSLSLPRVVCNLTVVVAVLVGFTGIGDDSRVTWPDLAAAIGVSAALLYILGVVAPASLADHVGDRVVVRGAGLIRAIHVAMRPIAWLARVGDVIVKQAAGAREQSPQEEIEQELMSVVAEGQSEGSLGASERMMIEGVVDMRTATAEDVMTPRTRIEGLEYTNDLATIKGFLERSGHSRIPVYQVDLDHIVGVLYAKDLLRCLGEDPAAFRLKPILREPHFVPESKPLLALLHELQSRKIHMALVLDEYGGVAGLVTIEDLIEEIVGEIVDEYEPTTEIPPRIEVIPSERAVEVDARAHIENVNDELEALRVALPVGEDYDTVGGFVTTALGRIPVTGEVARVNGMTLKVLEAEPTRVNKMRIEFDEPERPRAPERAEQAAPEAADV